MTWTLLQLKLFYFKRYYQESGKTAHGVGCWRRRRQWGLPARGERREDQGLARGPSPGHAGLPVLILVAPLPSYLTFWPQRLGFSSPPPRLWKAAWMWDALGAAQGLCAPFAVISRSRVIRSVNAPWCPAMRSCPCPAREMMERRRARPQAAHSLTAYSAMHIFAFIA